MKKWLFAIDLDGTLLKSSATNEVSKKDVSSIKKLISAGHIVCIMTGRPWAATKDVYKKLGLNTVIANYNGGQIHNPSDYNFIHNNGELNLNDALYILGDKKLKKITKNLIIEGPGWIRAEKKNKALEQIFGFKDIDNYKVGPINFHKIPLNPSSVVIDTTVNSALSELRHLQRKFNDLAEFSSWSKGEGETAVLDITAIGTTKGKALSLASRYYDIEIENTVAIGDGFNDVPMFEVAEISVAMANSHDGVKEKSTYITSKTNKENGVSEFIEKFLKDENGFIKNLRKLRKKVYSNDDETTAAH